MKSANRVQQRDADGQDYESGDDEVSGQGEADDGNAAEGQGHVSRQLHANDGVDLPRSV